MTLLAIYHPKTPLHVAKMQSLAHALRVPIVSVGGDWRVIAVEKFDANYPSVTELMSAHPMHVLVATDTQNPLVHSIPYYERPSAMPVFLLGDQNGTIPRAVLEQARLTVHIPSRYALDPLAVAAILIEHHRTRELQSV